MKLETGNWKLETRSARSGVALVVTLTIMALLLILATAFVVNMRGERAVATNYRRQVEARQAALAGLHAAVGKMNSFYAYAEAVNASVQTMGGRFYYTNAQDGMLSKALAPSISASVPRSTNMLMFSCSLADQLYTSNPNGSLTTNVANKVNMNVGSYTFNAPLDTSKQQSDYYLPIANPSVNLKWNSEKVGVWAGMWTVNRASFAFWVDDESSKINISNAATPNLSGLGHDNTFLFSDYANKVGYYPVVTPPPPYAALFQSSTKQISSVDLAVLDNKVVNGDSPFPSQQNWGDANTLISLEGARHAGSWHPFQGADEVLGLPNNVTMQDYQAVKPCLTAWSVENEDRAQLFRTNTTSITALTQSYPMMVARYNVAKTIETPLDAQKLYDFIIKQCDLPKSLSLKRFFSNATFQNKYPDTSLQGTNGSVNQIAANIVSYITDTTKTPPYGADGSGNPKLPTSYCGLWKAAYMNEIAFSFYWQKKTDPPIPPAVIGSTKYQLWAAMYVELINPYEIDMPRSGQGEYYTIDVDPDVSGNPPLVFLVTYNTAPTAPPIPKALPGNPVYANDVVNKIKAHSYSSPCNIVNADASPVPWIDKWQWPISEPWTFPVDPKNPSAVPVPPPVTQIRITMPKAIRMTMHKSSTAGIIDWFDKTQTLPSLGTLTVPAANCATIPVIDVVTIGKPLGFNAPAADYIFWNKGNPTRISIAKNDPRVHKWYGVKTPGGTAGITGHGDNPLFGVTIKLPNAGGVIPGWGDNNGQNPLGNINGADGSGGIVDFRGGDVEAYHNIYAQNANKPEYRSNFVIAERGMRSIGELGFIHTGKPWRSLSLQAYGTQFDERQPNGWPKPPGYSDLTAIPDWAILDLFSVYSPPIYGRININNGGWHLGSYTAGTYIPIPNVTFEDPTVSPLRPNLVANWRDAIGQWYGGVNSRWPFYTLRTSAYNSFKYSIMSSMSQSQKDAASLPMAAALNVIPLYQHRNMLANFITHRATNVVQNVPRIMDPYQPFTTVGEICEIACMTNHFAGDGTPYALGGQNPVAYTDADREDTVRRIINVLTTHGDAFTVYVIGSADGGEARLTAVVERTYDPAATQIIDKNKFRIRQIRWNTD